MNRKSAPAHLRRFHRLAGGVLLASMLAGCGGGSSSVVPGVINRPAVNPYLSAAVYGITHVDPSASDSTPYGPPRGVYKIDPTKQAVAYGGPVNIMTLAATDPDYMWAVGTDHVAYVSKKSRQWTQVAFLDAPAYPDPTLGPIPPANHKTFGESSAVDKTIASMDAMLSGLYGAAYGWRILNGGYSVVDRDNVLYANFGNGVYAFALANATDPSKGIAILQRIDDVSILVIGSTTDKRIFGLSMTYDGHLILAFKNGVAVIDRDLSVASSRYYAFGSGENVSNSIAVDENNGIYIATNTTMRKLVWTGTSISDKETDGAWASPYDSTTEIAPVIKFDTGTGSTPTLMGFGDDPDKLVVITDGDKNMKLVAFWRDKIPDWFVQKPGTASRRVAGQIRATCGFSPLPAWIQSEQSVVVNGYGAFVVNNIPTDTAALAPVSRNNILVVSLMGPAYPASFGVERFEWDSSGHEWFSVWTRSDVSSTSMIPIHSQSMNMVMVNGYTKERGWEVTGMDWATGKTVHQTIFGNANFGNGAYALVQYFENGDLLFNSISGVLRVKY